MSFDSIPLKERVRRAGWTLRAWARDSRKRWVLIGVVLLVVIIFFRACHGSSQGKKNKRDMGTLPVGVASAKLGDIPVYLDGLGTVNAYYNVTVHSRVDGQLMAVHFKEGQDVRRGDLMVELDPRPYQAALDQAEGLRERDAALLSNARVDLQRYQGLADQGAVPRQQLDTQQALVAQDEGAVKSDEAAAETARLQLVYSRVTAPISGRIGLRLVDPGNIVHASDANGLFVITQVQPIVVVFSLSEDLISSVMQKLQAGTTLQVEAYNRDKSTLISTGTLLAIDNEIDPTTGTSKLKAIFDNKDDALFPNQFVNIRLLLEVHHDQVITLAAAIQRGAQGSFVYVVHEDSTTEARTVTAGITEGNETVIDKGLQVGETVVIDGADKLQPGGKVTIAPPVGSTPADQAPTTPKHGHRHSHDS